MIVLYGATGFTGGLAAEYLATMPGVKWAMAGRDIDKLKRLRERLEVDVELIVARSDDDKSLQAMCERANVVISTVGPFAIHGEALVQACIATQTDYIDSTGEPQFVDGLINRHHATAKARGVRIVNCCGFDSIPHDIGAWYAAKELPQRSPIRVNAYISATGMVSGGTWNSALHAMGSRKEISREKRARIKGAPAGVRPVHNITQLHRNKQLGIWGCPMPTYDIDVVLRSASRLDGYGTDFSYGHHIAFKSLAKLGGLALGVGGIAALAQVEVLRKALQSLKKPGDGPDAATRAKHRFRETFVAETPDHRRVIEVSGGDVGYTETAKMLVQAALCIRDDRDRLPETFGVLTTAEAMAAPLFDRLPEAGLRFSVIDP